MPNILILGGGAAGLVTALAAAKSAPAAQVIVLERNPKPGKKLLATGNGRCNLDNTGIAPELYFTADPAALRPLLDAVNTADPLRWFRALGLYTRTDEAGRVYPYSIRRRTCWPCWSITLRSTMCSCAPAAPCAP